jgi:hypothetical protein
VQELIGKTIDTVWVNDDNTLLVFRCADGQDLAYRAYGDCCSESWFSSLVGLSNLVGHAVTGVYARPEIWGLPSARQEVDILYGYFIATDDARRPDEMPLLTAVNAMLVGDAPDRTRLCEIEFRNASNGYYGGACQLEESYNDPLTQVKADFPGEWGRRD